MFIIKWFNFPIIYIAIFMLNYLCESSTVVKFSKYKNLIEGVSKSLVNRYGARCATILHSNNRHAWFENRQIYTIYKMMTTDLNFQQPILVSSFKYYLDLHRHRSKEMRCPKIIFIILGWLQHSKKHFAEFSSKVSMSGSIWLIFLENEMSPEDFLEEAKTPFDSRLILASLDNGTLVRLREAYRVDDAYPLRILNYGHWTNEKLTAPKGLSLYSRRNDLEGYPVRVSTKDDVPICEVYRDEKGELRVGGYFGKIFYELSHQLNFTGKYVEAVENVTGSSVDGTWNGLIGMLQRNEIDFAAGPLTIERSALLVISFVRPLLRTNYQVFFKHEGNVIIWDSILKPFGTYIWILMMVWVLIGSLALNLSYKIGCKMGKENDLYQKEFSKINSVFIFLKALCFQGSWIIPRWWPCRLLYVTGYLMSTVLFTAYSASLISHLTTIQPRRPFDSLETLYDQSNSYTLTAIDRSTEYTYFSEGRDPLRKGIFEKMMAKIEKKDLPGGKEEGIDHVCYKYRHALFITYAVTQITARQYTREKKCTILHFTSHLDRVFITIGKRKNFPFSDLIEYQLQIMETSGILQRLQKQAWPLESKKRKESYFKEVNLEEVVQIHAVLLIGLIISLIICLIEILHGEGLTKKARKMKSLFDSRDFSVPLNQIKFTLKEKDFYYKNRKSLIR